ncbi:uncharacterized protein LOC132202453 isoform X2 [Neocloeon triangulifer]|uniref:uncharacterized protein LOC132202453 isoform X2 n=1 Tax=Neocloeon triangulifer TaxID=2078957 RepID=UPI00286F2980|nr:uncharacterized protein LOC132202453 isoform X2 [Neocloeon triangulifer]
MTLNCKMTCRTNEFFYITLVLFLATSLVISCPPTGRLHPPEECPVDVTKCFPCNKDTNEKLNCFCKSKNKTIDLICDAELGQLHLFNGRTGGLHCPAESESQACVYNCGNQATGPCACDNGRKCLSAIRKKTCRSVLDKNPIFQLEKEEPISNNFPASNFTLCHSDLNRCHYCDGTKKEFSCFCPALNRDIQLPCSIGGFVSLFNPTTGLPHCPSLPLSFECADLKYSKETWCTDYLKTFNPSPTTTTTSLKIDKTENEIISSETPSYSSSDNTATIIICIVTLVLILVALIGFITWWMRRRRSSQIIQPNNSKDEIEMVENDMYTEFAPQTKPSGDVIIVNDMNGANGAVNGGDQEEMNRDHNRIITFL